MRKQTQKRRFFANLSLTFAILPLVGVSVLGGNTSQLVAKMDPQYTLSSEGKIIEKEVPELDQKSPTVIGQNAILASRSPKTAEAKKPVTRSYRYPRPAFLNGKRMVVTATAYSSTVDQCDASPFITASGTHVHDGTLAANFLPFGTKVKIPAYFGDKVFIVEDRMASNHKIDIWYPSRGEALQFGARRVEIEIQ